MFYKNVHLAEVEFYSFFFFLIKSNGFPNDTMQSNSCGSYAAAITIRLAPYYIPTP